MSEVLRLPWRRAQRRIGASGLAAALLLLVAAAVAAWMPRLDREVAQLHESVALQRAALHAHATEARPEPSPADRLGQYVDAFPTLRQNAADLDAIFRSAQRHQLVLLKGEYQLKADAGSPFIAYSATLPVRSRYGAVKAFAADVLRILPHASLDELRISRDSAGADVLDAVVRFKLTYRSR